MRATLISTITLSLCLSCTEKKETKKETIGPLVIDITNDKYQTLNFPSLDSLIVLDSIGPVFWDVRMRYDSTNIFILNKNNSNSIYRYDRNGRLLNSIRADENLKGGIPFSTFILHDDTLEALSAYEDKSHLSIYNRSGVRLSEVELRSLDLSFERMGYGNYLFYSSYNFPIAKWRLREVRNDSTVHEYFKNDYKGVKFPVYENNFFSFGGNSVLFFESFNPNIYRISADAEPVVEYKIDMGKYSIDSSFWNAHIRDGFNTLMTNGYYNIFNIFENQQYVFIDLRFSKIDEKTKFLQLIVNKETKEIKKLTGDLNEHNIFAFPVVLTNDNQIGYLMNPGGLLEVVDKGDLSVSKVQSKIKRSWSIKDNTVLGFVSLNTTNQ